MTALKAKGKPAVKNRNVICNMENLLLIQDFTSLQNENEKLVSGLLTVQFVSPQFCNIKVSG